MEEFRERSGGFFSPCVGRSKELDHSGLESIRNAFSPDDIAIGHGFDLTDQCFLGRRKTIEA